MEKRPKYEECWDMPLGGTSDEPHIPHLAPTIIVGTLSFICKVLFRYRVDNRESIAALAGKTGVVVVCNHTSFLDVLFMYFSVRPCDWARFVARDSLFEGKPYWFAWVISHVGAFPIKRDTADRTAIKRAAKMLKNNEVVCILPEGTRRGKGSKTPEIHGGAALIAKMGKAPILPMTVRNAEYVKQKGKLVHFPKITCEFGDPVVLSDFDFLPKEERLEGCIWYAMRECFALNQNCAPNEVDMVALFPEGKDYTDVFAQHEVPHHTSGQLAREIEEHAAQKVLKSTEPTRAADGVEDVR